MAKDGRRNDGCRDAVQQVCISAVEQRRHVKSHVARVVFGQYLTRDQRELLLLSSARRTLASSSETLSISANTERLHGQVGPFCFGWAGRRRSVPPILLLPPPLFHTLKVYGFRLFASFFFKFFSTECAPEVSLRRIRSHSPSRPSRCDAVRTASHR